MDTEETQTTAKRRSNSQGSANSPKRKKSKLFSVKEFRKKLNSEEKLIALKQFGDIINVTEHDYILDYLEGGGSCLELLQILENDTAIQPALIFDLVAQILLRINASYGQYHSSGLEACRYLLNSYITLIQKMIGLSSSKDERKSCLKLLTAMATFSPNLAKDILLNVKFHSANIELLSKNTAEEDSVRDTFVHFLTAFLVEGNEHILLILLERAGLLTSIISGLQYDTPDTVCIVITAMKNHILENPAVSKTTKMLTFNTQVVRDIVNLYNWRGPNGLKMLEKNNKAVFEVDQFQKSKVSECVHSFLIVLCANNKFGVIFKDPLVGLGKKNQNSLMYTVLESLAKPWEHSYASDLVLNICRACPDLVKHLWTILKPFIEPRLSDKWLIAIKFAAQLVKVVEPKCIEYCAKNLNPQQMAQIIELLIAPFPILRTLLPEDNNYASSDLKRHIYDLLFVMLQALCNYIETAKSWISLDYFKKVKIYLSNYVGEKFPQAQILLKDWTNFSDNSEVNLEYLSRILDILDLYKNLAPQLLYNLTSAEIDLKEILLRFSPEENTKLQTKVVNIFIDLDQAYFSPKTEVFEYILPKLLKIYHRDKSREVLTVLHKLLQNTNIFEGCFYEINTWINGILNCDTFCDDVANCLVPIIQNASVDTLEYQDELSDIKVDDTVPEKFEEIIQVLNLADNDTNTVNNIKHRYFSILVISLLKNVRQGGCTKSMKEYIEFVLLQVFHSQTSISKFCALVEKYHKHLPENVLIYFRSWFSKEGLPLRRFKGALSFIKGFSNNFLNNAINETTFTEMLYPNQDIDILQMSTFYFSNMFNENTADNWKFVVSFYHKKCALDENRLNIVFGNPNIIIHFDILDSSRSICTKTVFELVKNLNLHGEYLDVYANKIFNNVIKILKKPKKYSSCELTVGDLLNTFNLSYIHCASILSKLAILFSENLYITDHILFDIMCYSLERISYLCSTDSDLKPLEEEAVKTITNYAFNLDSKNLDKFSKALKCYLDVFPHSIGHIDKKIFTNLLQITEYKKENVDLLMFLLERNPGLKRCLADSLDNITEKKFIILPLTHVLINSKVNENLLETIYRNLEASILKALQKPQKVGQHFQKNYDIAVLIEKFMPYEKYKTFSEKVQKFEVTEIFHVRLLEAVFKKTIENEPNEKQISNIIMTLVHLSVNSFKHKDGDIKVDEISNYFSRILETIVTKKLTLNAENIANSEAFKTYCKFCLKFGVSGKTLLLRNLTNILIIFYRNPTSLDAALILDMLLSHSQFLDVVLGEHVDTKLEVLKLLLVLCDNFELIERSHVPIILAAYRAKITKCDRILLKLLKVCELKADKTNFYDFKPFLWGRAAAIHYSVRSNIENALIRQPKTSDILDLLKEDMVNASIKNYPFTESLYDDQSQTEIIDIQSYDLKFMLPLFSQILASEQQVKTYKFTRSGGLSLTVIGLTSSSREVRQAACHVLSRFHFHLEARQTGKDNLLWIRYVEALCKGVALLPNFKLNNFSGIFFSRMALVLTQPSHIMYYPLSRYLMAKEELQLGTVPELYTLLHSPEVNFKEHRTFILEVLKDGLRNEADFKDFLKSMALKLFSELASSCLSDMDTRVLILDIISAACKLPLGVKVLCENHSILVQLHTEISNVLLQKKHVFRILQRCVNILLDIVKTRTDKYTNNAVSNLIFDIVKTQHFQTLNDEVIQTCFEVIYIIYSNCPETFKDGVKVEDLLKKCDDKFCEYVLSYGCKFIPKKSFKLSDKYYYLRLLVYKMFSTE